MELRISKAVTLISLDFVFWGMRPLPDTDVEEYFKFTQCHLDGFDIKVGKWTIVL